MKTYRKLLPVVLLASLAVLPACSRAPSANQTTAPENPKPLPTEEELSKHFGTSSSADSRGSSSPAANSKPQTNASSTSSTNTKQSGTKTTLPGASAPKSQAFKPVEFP
jgi:hypothetical protein